MNGVQAMTLTAGLAIGSITFSTLGLAFAAGVLSTLSPCVLPLLPIVLATAASEHRLGPVALAAGLALGFAAIGLFIATVGVSIGLDAGIFRYGAAAVLIVIGLVLALPVLQERFAVAAGPASQWAGDRLSSISGKGFSGQFAVGLLLGAVWSPCTGPTLGAATLLAAQGKSLDQAAATMLTFGLGAAAPLLVLGMLSREAMLGMRNRLMQAGGPLRTGFGLLLLVAGLLVLSGLDKTLEAKLVAWSPQWLTDLTTRF
jgi:cytochrome c-type biogenesis protein